MSNLEMLTNNEKAKLFVQLFPGQQRGIVDFIAAGAKQIVHQQEHLRKTWDNQWFGVETWIELAKDIVKATETPQKIKMLYSPFPARFADQLFDGYRALVSTHLLTQYIKQSKDTRFQLVGAGFYSLGDEFTFSVKQPEIEEA